MSTRNERRKATKKAKFEEANTKNIFYDPQKVRGILLYNLIHIYK